jgi:allantoinase
VSSIRSARVVLGAEVRPASIRYEDGVIVEIGDGPAEIDVGDLVIMPGLVDSHVHVNEPGRADWEGFRTATMAAAAGGSTTIVDMPLNSTPPTVDVGALLAKREAARGRISVDVAFWGGLIPGSESGLYALVSEGVCGFKSFLPDSGVPEFPPMPIDELRHALKSLDRPEIPMLIHAEDPLRLGDFRGDATVYVNYLRSRPPDAEAAAAASMASLSAETGSAIHIVHVSSAEGAEAVAVGPATLSAETCPHYLTFAAEDIADGATTFKCAPPIREASQREALWDALRQGSLAMIVSDHSPAPPELKEVASGDFEKAWGGIASLELRLPAIWSGASGRGFSLSDLAHWLSTAPARLAGLDSKGVLEAGKDADLVVFDPDGVTEVVPASLHQRHSLTPYDGMSLRGSVVSTMLRGVLVFDDGRVRDGGGRMLVRS